LFIEGLFKLKIQHIAAIVCFSIALFFYSIGFLFVVAKALVVCGIIFEVIAWSILLSDEIE